MRPFGISLAIRSRLLTKLASSVLILAAAAPAHAQEPVEFGDVITEPGVYFLRGNQSGSGVGIQIESDDVTLLLGRFTLRGDGFSTGIHCFEHDNVTIWGGRVTEFRFGVFVNGGENCHVRDTRIDHCEAGLFFVRLVESSAVRVRADQHLGNGVIALNCSAVRLVSVLSHDNGGHGFFVGDASTFAAAGSDSHGNKLRLCWAAYNGNDGIHVLDSQDNQLKSNQCVGNSGAGIRIRSTSGDLPDVTSGPGTEPSAGNHLEANWCVFNRDGIVVEPEATDNTIHENTALANSGHDLVDNNDEPPCVNTWFLNFFLSKDGSGEDCIF